MQTLCTYKNIFGKPNEGIHSTRIFGFAFWDIFFTVILAFLIYYFFGYNFWFVLLILFILAEIAHMLFCVDTAFTRLFK